jgi:hypothetical protein
VLSRRNSLAKRVTATRHDDMNTVKRGILVQLAACIVFSHSYLCAQQIEAPVYTDGDWWKVRVAVRQIGKGTRYGRCDELYSTYTVKHDQGRFRVFGETEGGDENEEIDCPVIVSQLLGINRAEDRTLAQNLNFPLEVGKNWTSYVWRKYAPTFGTIHRRIIVLDHKVLSWQKIKIRRRALDALRIELTGPPAVFWIRSALYYSYAPEAKAIVNFSWPEQYSRRRVRLIDFNVSE